MNILKKLEIEIPGIKGLLESYTSESTINNLINKCEEAVHVKDIEVLIYLLNSIKNWYERNMLAIQSNSHVLSPEEHTNAYNSICQYIEELNSYNANIEIVGKTKMNNKVESPKIFIGSSTEGLSLAKALQMELEHESEPTIWTQGIFKLTHSTLTDLIDSFEIMDAAVFILTPDDIQLMRGNQQSVPRDNLIFELGLAIGILNRDNVFFIIPRNTPDFHLPTDLLGITPGTYNSDRSDGNIQAALAPSATKILQQIKG